MVSIKCNKLRPERKQSMHLAFDPGDNKKEGKEVEAWV